MRCKTSASDLMIVRKPNSLLERVFQGTSFDLERKGIPAFLGLNFLALGVIVPVVAGFEFRPLSWSGVFLMLGASIIASVPGRWFALLLFSFLIVFTTIWGTIRPHGFLEQWFVDLAFFSGFFCIAVFARRIYGRLRSKPQR